MKVIYIAGKYRDERGEWFVQENIRLAEAEAIFVWINGAVAICPHKNTERFGGICSDLVWLDGDLEIIERCDAVYAISNWTESKGATKEVEYAKIRGIPVLFGRNDVRSFLVK